ncbi:MAG: DinB family protein [Bryobacteraceae bacterium]|jgi:uncharacterized damage-inducible protein DinB
MSLTAEQAKALADYTLADYQNELATTKRVIGAIPAGQESYTPDAKSTKALDLAWHIASAEWFFLNSISEGKFASGESGRPEHIRSAKDVVAWYDENVPPALERTGRLSGEHLAKDIDFFGKMQAPAAVYLTLMVKHGVHHRGQLSAYLRPMGAKVPGIYGPSGDTQ